jgi:hypothetical protein
MQRLLGKTLALVNLVRNDEIHFTTTDGICFKMHHESDCCEQVYIEDICGDLKDLIGSPILVAEEVSSTGTENLEHPIMKEEILKSILKQEKLLDYEDEESITWTFYKLDTNKVRAYHSIK